MPADGLGEALGGIDTLGDGLGVSIASGWVGVASAGTAGASARSPPSNIPATATPTIRPATIDKRAFMSRGGYQYERSTAPRKDRCYHAAPMRHLADRIRTRIAPALLTAFGVTFLAAGVLSLTTTAAADPVTTPAATASPDVAVSGTPGPLITLPPLGSGGPPPPVASFPPGRVATRVRIRDLGIDLAIVKGNTGYPFCNVAMYLPQLSQPGFNKATYLYAHAREGMFLPLLKTKSFDQRGLVVEVWTSDDWLYKYKITQVRRDQPYSTGLNDPAKAKSEQLWLQTSQGPGRQYGYTQVIAKPIDARPTDHDASHPTPRPVDCG